MAIIKLISPETACNLVTDGLLVTCNGTSTPAMQLANNNRSQKKGSMGKATSASSAAFLNLDTMIKNLDAEFELLNAGGKSAWETYADNIDGEWQLCANCFSGDTAKKLYRQYNFNRMMSGLAPAATPVDNTEAAQCDLIAMEYAVAGSTVAGFALGNQNGGTVGDWWIANVGLALQNPVYQTTGVEDNTVVTSGPWFDFIQDIWVAIGVPIDPFIGTYVYFQMCQWTADGAPGLQIQVGLYAIQEP